MLLSRLVAATRRSSLQWAKSGDETYLTSLGGYSVTISSIDGDGHPPYRLSILDDQAIEIAAVDWLISPTPYGSIAAGQQNETLNELYKTVRASVVDVGGAISNILRALDERDGTREEAGARQESP